MRDPIANVYAILTGAAILPDDSIYTGAAAQGAAPPFIVWRLIANTAGLVLSGRPSHDRQLVQIDAYAHDDSEARTLAFAARDALEPVAPVTRGPVQGAQDPDTRLHRWTLDASFIHAREVA